jgi:hypothetical protein
MKKPQPEGCGSRSGNFHSPFLSQQTDCDLNSDHSSGEQSRRTMLLSPLPMLVYTESAEYQMEFRPNTQLAHFP